MASPDVAASLTSSATLAADLVPLFIRERTLMLSERQLILHQFGDKEMLPEGQGKTLQFPPQGLETFVPAVAKGTWKP